MSEADRLNSLQDLMILDTEPEAEFDAIVKAAAMACGVPMCLISLVDTDRQWFKANVGLPHISETPRSVAFCDYTIQQEELFEVADCLQDERFANNPLVAGDPDLRFYAGVPLCLSDGSRVGSLCVLDNKPGALTPTQRSILRQLSLAASHALESRRSAKALIASESRYRTLCAASPMGIFGMDAAGMCTYSNARWQSISGLSYEECLGLGWHNAVHPEDRAAVLSAWERASAGQHELVMEFRIASTDGRERVVRVMSKPILTSEGDVIGHVGLIEDVTDHRAQRKLQRERDLLINQTSELAKVGGWELNLLTDKVTWSEQTRLIHGLPAGYQPQLDTAVELYTEQSREDIRRAFHHLMNEGAAFDMELQLVKADGASRWVRVVGDAEWVDGKPVRMRGAIQDIDDSIRQRLALESAHERITIATDSGDVGVWEWNVGTNSLEWTPQMSKLYGIDPADKPLDFQEWVERVHPDDKDLVLDTLAKAVTSGDDLEQEYRIVWPDGSIRHLHSSAHVKRDAAGKALMLVGVNWDVTQLRRLASDLAEQHELLRVTMQSIDDAVITVDTQGRITWLNPSAELLTGWSCSKAIGKPLARVYEIVHEMSGLPVESSVTECLRKGTRVNHNRDLMLVTREGLQYGVEDSAAPIRDAQGQLLGAVLVFRDVSEQRHLTQVMMHRATHDELTQLYNRSEFETRLRKLISRLQSSDDKHALMFIDLDQFKLVNDACGHPVGDQLLRQIAGILRQSLRESDVLARLGGDEFGVILHDCNVDLARNIAQGICDTMNDFRFAHGARRFRIGVSIGLVPLDSSWKSLAAIMKAADTSCYTAKDAGRNRVHVWFDTDHAMHARRGDMQWAGRLEQSLDENRFELHAQRLVHLDTDRTGLNAEVLVRLRDETGELIQPAAFLPAAERFHLATRIDRWVLRNAIAQLTELPDLSGIELLWINLSGQSIGDRDFHRDAIRMLSEAGQDICRRICLEITETAAITNITNAADFITRLKGLQVRTALDDFGAGASSFGYLKSLPVDILKIDGQFISTIIDDPLAAAAVRCFVDVAGVVGLQTVAEHVESEAVLARVRSLGLDFAQGYLLHEPEPIRLALDGWLKSSSKVADRRYQDLGSVE